MLESHDWPGNVRELRNFAQRVTYRSLSEGARSPVQVDLADLDPFASPYRPTSDLSGMRSDAATPVAATPQSAIPDPAPDLSFEEQVKLFETRLIDDALAATEGHQGKAAKRLGLSYHQFRGLLEKHDYGKGAGKPKPTPKPPIRAM
jgi:psp operon transcriptional activator